MGLSLGYYHLLTQLVFKHKLKGDILTLGEVDTFMTNKDLQNIYKKNGIQSISSEELNNKTIFYNLGFKKVTSLDFSSYEGSELVHDLNLPLTSNFTTKYDVILDHGTLEHVFDLKTALENVFKLLNVGGVVVHFSPTNNFVDHGFYQFSPTLFRDFYTSNNWLILECLVTKQLASHNTPLTIMNADERVLERLSYGGWGSHVVGTVFLAKKTKLSTGNLIPQQSFYKNLTWGTKTTSMPILEHGSLKNTILSITFVGTLARILHAKWKIAQRKKLVRSLKKVGVY